MRSSDSEVRVYGSIVHSPNLMEKVVLYTKQVIWRLHELEKYKHNRTSASQLEYYHTSITSTY